MKNFRVRKLLDFCFNNSRSKSVITGYGSSELLEAIILKNKLRIELLEKNEPITSNEFQAVALLNYVYSGKPLTVVDFGGGAANHFYVCEKFISERIANWVVIETPRMVEGCRKEFQHPKLSFIDDLKNLEMNILKPDVIFTSSALQYTLDPLHTMRKLLELGARSLIITRTPLTELDEPVSGEQKSLLSSNGPGPLPEGIRNSEVFYPIDIPTKKSVESLICENHRIKLNISEGLTNFQNVGKFNCYTFVAIKEDNF